MFEAAIADVGAERALIRRLVESLAGQQAKAAEQRRLHRFPLNMPVILHIGAGRSTQVISGWAGEASCGGVSVLTGVELFPGRVVTANFEAAVGRPCHVPIQLTHGARLIEGIYRSGGCFCIGSDETGGPAAGVRSLIEKLVDGLAARQANLDEHRSRPRLPLNMPVRISGADDVRWQPASEAWALEISHEGLGFLTTRPLRPGCRVVVDLQRPVGRTCRVDVEVSNSAKLFDGLFRGGGAFRLA